MFKSLGLLFLVVGKDFCLQSIELTESFGQFPFSPSKDYGDVRWYKKASGSWSGGLCVRSGLSVGCVLFPFVPDISDL